MTDISNKLVKNSIYVGLLTFIIGIIVEKLLVWGDKKDNFLTRMKNVNIMKFYMTLFMFGILVHLFSDLIGLEAYCERKCIEDVCNYQCYVRFK